MRLSNPLVPRSNRGGRAENQAVSLLLADGGTSTISTVPAETGTAGGQGHSVGAWALAFAAERFGLSGQRFGHGSEVAR